MVCVHTYSESDNTLLRYGRLKFSKMASWTKYHSEPHPPDSIYRDQDDDHRKCRLGHYMDTDLRLLYATRHRENPQNVLARLLYPDFLGISLRLCQPVYLCHLSLILSGASWCV